MEHLLSSMSYTAVLTTTALVFLGVFALIEIANCRITTHARSAIVPNAVGSLFYAVVVWVWPALYVLPDYFRRQHGDPIYRVRLSRELLIGFSEAWQPARNGRNVCCSDRARQFFSDADSRKCGVTERRCDRTSRAGSRVFAVGAALNLLGIHDGSYDRTFRLSTLTVAT